MVFLLNLAVALLALSAWAKEEKCLEDGRCYKYVSSSGATKAPIVVHLHGWGDIKDESGWPELQEKYNFFLVQPLGIDKSWNAGDQGYGCCGGAYSKKIDDVAFITAVVDDVIANNIDEVDMSRIYFAGHSVGCSMAQRLAAEASDMVTAVACHSHYLLTPTADEYVPVPIMQIHGEDDDVVSYVDSDMWETGAEGNARTWAEANGCNLNPTIKKDTEIIELTYSQCHRGRNVTLLKILGADHSPYMTDYATTEMAWDFLSNFVTDDLDDDDDSDDSGARSLYVPSRYMLAAITAALCGLRLF